MLEYLDDIKNRSAVENIYFIRHGDSKVLTTLGDLVLYLEASGLSYRWSANQTIIEIFSADYANIHTLLVEPALSSTQH